MSKTTKIQWCDSTVNPTLGCDGCELWESSTHICYAGVLTARFGRSNPGLADDFNVIELAPGRMADAARWSDLTVQSRPNKSWLDGLPRLIFIGDMADNFSRYISFRYLLEEVITAVTSEDGSRHEWLWLTKRPKRMARFSGWLKTIGFHWPSNLWAGTSVTTQARTNRVEQLLAVGDANTIRFVSVEPQWGPIDLTQWLPYLDWVIQGGQSGRHDHPFALEWADDLREQCRADEVPYFLKQLGSCVTRGGEHLQTHRGHGGDWSAWPPRFRVRQMPTSVRRDTIRPGIV